jgi:diguanylate cyclase (GGDEF)-like protein
MEQYTKTSEHDKSQLLLDAIEPIVAIHLFLGFDQSLNQYLEEIVQKNPLILQLSVQDMREQIHFYYRSPIYQEEASNSLNFERIIYDKVSPGSIGQLEMVYSTQQYTKTLNDYRQFSILILVGTASLMMILIILLRHTLNPLRELAQELLNYEPATFHFSKKRVHRQHEVAIIQNAVIHMVEKIQNYTKRLYDLNLKLESKVKERTKTLEIANNQLRNEISDRKKAEKELRYANEKLETLSTKDALTNLYNRRILEQKLQTYWQTAWREKSPLSIIMCDIDFFKKINDTYGHQMGDHCLQEIAKVFENSISRPTDIIARYGGEEFIFVLPDTPASGALRIAEAIQNMLKKRNICSDTKVKMTLSIGISSVIPTKEIAWSALIQAADEALYEAKHNGRNRIVVRPL